MSPLSETTTAPLALERVACNLCGSQDHRLLYRKPDTRHWLSSEVFDAVRCRRCGLGFVNPRPTRQSMRLFYPPAFYAHRDQASERPRYARQARYLEGSAPGRVLDIGCATGGFLSVMAAQGWEPFGMDVVESRRDLGFPVRYGELPDLGYPSGFFDAVTAWAVFEHLHDPAAYFREVGRILRPGGRFILLVTNLNSAWSRFAYAEDVPRHLYFYSPRTLRRYAGLAGLGLVRIDFGSDLFPPDSTDVFRVQLLRRCGVDWRQIFGPPSALPPSLRVVGRMARGLGVLLMRPRVEAALRIRGIVVAVMDKPR